MMKRSDARLWRIGGCVLGGALLIMLAWKWSDWRAQAQVGAASAAHVACSCRYVEGRDIGSCKGDVAPGDMPDALVSITDRPEEKAVSAGVPLMARRTARYRRGFGCLLDPA